VTPQDLSERDRVEVERSAAEARRAVLAPVDVDRYLDPPADTPYGLEYAFYLLGDIRGKTVLDLGCGSGESLVPLARRGAHVIGIDISPELIRLARQRLSGYGLAATLRDGSAYATGLADESVDVVFSMALLHHLDLPTARNEIQRVLRPGGLFILREPIRFSPIINSLRQLFPAPKADISDYEHPMTRAELSIVMQGFTMVAQRTFRLPFVPLLTKVKVLRIQAWKTDRWLLKHLPGLEHFATGKVISLRK
jgi:2-polyprenyl-3-methyl-5-hydroxy-6-metoxy-1,4-benzoquinol methylase